MAYDSALTPGQASYLVERFLTERRISTGEINRYLSELSEEIRVIETRLEELHAASARTQSEAHPGSAALRESRKRRSTGRRPRKARALIAPADAPTAAPAALREEPRKRRRSSPAVRARQKVHGSYVGYIRQVAPAKRPEFQRIAKDQGFEAAIKALRVHLGR